MNIVSIKEPPKFNVIRIDKHQIHWAADGLMVFRGDDLVYSEVKSVQFYLVTEMVKSLRGEGILEW